MAEGLFDFFSRARGQERRAALEGLLTQFIPPELRPQLGLLAEATPTRAAELAGQSAGRMVQPGLSGWERMAAAGDTLSNMAGVLAPVAAGRAVGMAPVQAVEEALLGASASPQMAAVRDYLVDDFGGVSVPGVAYDPAAERGQQIMDMLRSGRGADVTDDMLDMGDPVQNARLNEWLFSNYDLPMDYTSRMARAEAMGRSEDYFKGMYPYDSDTGPVRDYKGRIIDRADSIPQEINSINRPGLFPTFNRADPAEPGYAIAGVMGRDPNVANNFAGWGDAAVFPLKVDLGRQYQMDAQGGKAAYTHFFEEGRPFRDAMRSDAYDSGVILNTSDEGDIAFLKRPESIRSRFARFDPRLSHLRNLNAALAGGIPLYGLLSTQPEQEQY